MIFPFPFIHPSTHPSDQIFIEHPLYAKHMQLVKSGSEAYYGIAVLCPRGEGYILIIQEHFLLSLPTIPLFLKLPPHWQI